MLIYYRSKVNKQYDYKFDHEYNKVCLYVKNLIVRPILDYTTSFDTSNYRSENATDIERMNCDKTDSIEVSNGSE